MKDEMRCDRMVRWDDGGAQCDLCVNDILVEKPLHGDNPTLSALKVRVQWHETSLHLGTISAAVDGHALLCAPACPSHSTLRC